MNWGEAVRKKEQLDKDMMIELWTTIRHVQLQRGKDIETAELTANLLCYAAQRGLCTVQSIIMRALEYAQGTTR